jgi:two-component system phosphate regulon sensor histidine kinase PhoR
VQAKIFWKLGLTYAALLLAALLAVDLYAERMLRSDTLRAAEERLALASLVILALGIASTLIYARAFSARVERLKSFSRRVAEGDFRPLPSERNRDELSELTEALNETAARLDGVIRTLTEERNRSAAILRSMVEGVAVIDAKERMVFCNEAFMEILGPDSAGGEGGTLLEVTRQPELIGVIRRALESGEVASSEVAVGTVAARTYSATAAPVPVRTTAGDGPGVASAASPQAAVVVLHDITELRRLERARRDFVANVSHEFKTPLTAIQGFAETLLGGALEDRENNRRFLEIIREHAVRLARLTDDLLKLSRIEAGKFDLELGPLKLADVIVPCLETAGFKTAQKGQTLEADIPRDLPLVRGDASSLSELLQNLLDNAVQYTPRGGRIRVSVRVAGEQAVLTVSDTGIGIPQAEQERIFERFYRVDAARSREAGGTGLGLAIAKHIAESHGGRIWVDSAVGQGSQFHFSIPLASQA